MLFNENGNEVEGSMTSEEIEDLIQEKKEELDVSNQKAINELEETHQKTLTDLQTEISNKEEELEKEKNKEKNFGSLRNKGKEKDEAISKLTDEVNQLKSSFEEKISEVKTGSIQEKISEQIVKLAGDNKELKDKINVHLQAFKVPENIEEALKQVDNAFILSSDNKASSIINSKIISSAGDIDIPDKSKGITPEGKEFSKKQFGLTDQDFEKYGKK